MSFDIDKLLTTYSGLVEPEYRAAIVGLIENNEKYRPPDLKIAEATIIDATEHVQACSQYYTYVSTLAAHAKSAFKLAEAKYKQKYKKALGESEGKNAEKREADAATASETEHDTMVFFESAMNLFSSMEQSARVAADSSRKIADLIHSLHITEAGNKY